MPPDEGRWPGESARGSFVRCRSWERQAPRASLGGRTHLTPDFGDSSAANTRQRRRLCAGRPRSPKFLSNVQWAPKSWRSEVTMGEIFGMQLKIVACFVLPVDIASSKADLVLSLLITDRLDRIHGMNTMDTFFVKYFSIMLHVKYFSSHLPIP